MTSATTEASFVTKEDALSAIQHNLVKIYTEALAAHNRQAPSDKTQPPSFFNNEDVATFYASAISNILECCGYGDVKAEITKARAIILPSLSDHNPLYSLTLNMHEITEGILREPPSIEAFETCVREMTSFSFLGQLAHEPIDTMKYLIPLAKNPQLWTGKVGPAEERRTATAEMAVA